MCIKLKIGEDTRVKDLSESHLIMEGNKIFPLRFEYTDALGNISQVEIVSYIIAIGKNLVYFKEKTNGEEKNKISTFKDFEAKYGDYKII